MKNLDAFTQSYLETALWSSTDEGGTPLDANFSIADLSPEVIERAIRDCKRFQLNAESHLEGYDDAQAGHDFWLTRNRHGAGFWDGDYKKRDGENLTAISHRFGEINLYIGDDGKLFFFGGN